MAPYELEIPRRWQRRRWRPEYSYEVEVARLGTVIETVRVRARDEYEARDQARRYVAANLYTTGVKFLPGR